MTFSRKSIWRTCSWRAGLKAQLWMKQYAGQTTTVTFYMPSEESSTAEFLISDVQFVDVNLPPVATIDSGTVAVGDSTATFSVTYTDPDDTVRSSTIDGNDILVTGPNGFSQYAARVSTDPSTDGSSLTATYQISAPGGAWTLNDTGTYTATMQADQVSDSNGRFVAAGVLRLFDIMPQPTVIIDQAVAQADPTNDSPINSTMVFSKAVTDFATDDVTLSGTAGATTAIVTGSGTTYNVAVSGMARRGTVSAVIAAGAAVDAAGNANVASISTNNEVVFTPWHNTAAAYDVDGDGSVASSDVLCIINHLNSGTGDASLPTHPAGTHPFYDVNDDNICTPLDVLEVINYINSHPSGSSQGETAAPTAEVAALPSLVGTPFGAAVPMLSATDELRSPVASADSAMDSRLLPAWTQATSPPMTVRFPHVPVPSATDLHSRALLDDDCLVDLEGILEEITPAIAERYGASSRPFSNLAIREG